MKLDNQCLLVLDAIIEQLDPPEVAQFSQTCQYISSVCKPRLHKERMKKRSEMLLRKWRALSIGLRSTCRSIIARQVLTAAPTLRQKDIQSREKLINHILCRRNNFWARNIRRKLESHPYFSVHHAITTLMFLYALMCKAQSSGALGAEKYKTAIRREFERLHARFSVASRVYLPPTITFGFYKVVGDYSAYRNVILDPEYKSSFLDMLERTRLEGYTVILHLVLRLTQ